MRIKKKSTTIEKTYNIELALTETEIENLIGTLDSADELYHSTGEELQEALTKLIEKK